MIHYTLLPEKEIRALKREYRTRLTIFFLFFASCSVFIGIISLFPAYIYSYTQEKEVIDKLSSLQKDRKDRGSDDILKELSDNNVIINKLKSNKDLVIFSNIITQIIDNKPYAVSINSFDLKIENEDASSTIMAIIQGKSSKREALIQFRDKLQANPFVSNVELPIADLAKNKDISYSIKLSIIPIN